MLSSLWTHAWLRGKRSMSILSMRNWASLEPNSVGLLETPIHRPSDFDTFLDDSIVKIRNLKKELDANDSPLQATLILDEMSDTICRVSDVCDLLRHVHPDESFRTSAEATHARANQFVQELNTNISYYKSFVSALDSNSPKHGLMFGQLSEEQQYVSKLLRTDFEKSGIHLDESKRSKVVELNSRIIDLENDFRHSSQSSFSTAYFNKEDFQMLSPTFTPKHRASVREIHGSDRKFEVTAPISLFSQLVRYCPTSTLRKEVYRASMQSSKQTLNYLDEMLDTRHELALLLGFKSFSHFSSCYRFVDSPEKAIRFLGAYANSIKPQAQKELEILSSLKRAHDPDPTIYEWDLAYTKNLWQQHSPGVEDTTPYDFLDLEKLYDGLIFLSKTLFSLNVVPTQMQPGESWHEDVRKLTFYKEDGHLLGTLYLDVFARPNKSNFAGLFICRASRQNRQGVRQPAAVSIVASFPKYQAKNRLVVSRKNVETLFHEYGHALHNITSNTQFQHTSGTRCPIDFVEVPSTLMEKFPFRASGLSPYLYSPEAGRTITGDLMEKINKMQPPTKALEIEEQILRSTVDMLYHGPRPLSANTTQLYHDTRARVASIPPFRETQPQGHFLHLIHYAAGYYSYLCGDVVSDEIWSKVFEDNPLDPNAGKSLVDNLLQHGGSKPAKSIIRDVLRERAMENEHIRILLEDEAARNM